MAGFDMGFYLSGLFKNMMNGDFFTEQLVFILRLAAAACCGSVIGYERESHLKLAGIRTHSIVAVAAALITIISKYGFDDMLNLGTNVSLDPSRIAAGIVTAIGFLGAGVIFTREMSVSGLTTSAGLWATVGIGMAVGSGLYGPGIACTLLILIMQIIFQRSSRVLKSPTVEKLVLRVRPDAAIESLVQRAFDSRRIKVININVGRVGEELLEIKLYVTFPETCDLEQLLVLFREIPEILSIDVSMD